jgi:lysozyme
MRPRHRVSRAAIELIKRFEGYRAKAAQLPDGRWTIGYGHTLTAREGAEVSESDAEALLIYDLIPVTHLINENVFTPITQNQFDALVSFAFNVGADSFRGSQVLKRLNSGDTVQAACSMELWRKAQFEGGAIVIDALVRRRASEKTLFLTPPNDAWIPAPSPVLRPLVDIHAGDLIPAERPAEVVTSFEGPTVTLARDDAAPVAASAPSPEPGETLRAAAESVAARLQSIMPEPGEEPAPEEVRPQADFAPPITTPLEPELEPEPEAEAASVLDESFEVPPAPPGARTVEPKSPPYAVIHDIGAYEFIPARVTPLPRKKEPSVVLDIVLGLLGLAFFSFGVVWGLTAKPDYVANSLATPFVVAALAGLAGVGFFMVAIFRLLQRLGRAAEHD